MAVAFEFVKSFRQNILDVKKQVVGSGMRYEFDTKMKVGREWQNDRKLTLKKIVIISI